MKSSRSGSSASACQTLSGALPLARSIERRLFEPFDEAEQTALRNQLERMREQAEKIGPGADYDAGA